MILTKLHLLPGLVVFAVFGAFIVTYIIAVNLDHIRAFFPYISDTGTTIPESTIFGLFLNLGSIFIFLTMYVRYLYVKRCYLNDPNLLNFTSVKRLNSISLWLAAIISLGGIFVANFQETVAFIPHMIGAFCCFGVGSVYFCLQTVISYSVCPQLNSLQMARFRLLLSVLGVFLTSSCGIFGIASYFLFSKTIADIPLWAPEDGGFELHVVSSFSEWATLMVFAVYFITFIKEFKNLVMNCPTVEPTNEITNHSYNSYTISTVDRTNKKIEEDNNKNIAVSSERMPSSNIVHPA